MTNAAVRYLKKLAEVPAVRLLRGYRPVPPSTTTHINVGPAIEKLKQGAGSAASAALPTLYTAGTVNAAAAGDPAAQVATGAGAASLVRPGLSTLRNVAQGSEGGVARTAWNVAKRAPWQILRKVMPPLMVGGAVGDTVSGKGVARAVLPTAGMILGSLSGAGTGGWGTIPGAILGHSAGEAAAKHVPDPTRIAPTAQMGQRALDLFGNPGELGQKWLAHQQRYNPQAVATQGAADKAGHTWNQRFNPPPAEGEPGTFAGAESPQEKAWKRTHREPFFTKVESVMRNVTPDQFVHRFMEKVAFKSNRGTVTHSPGEPSQGSGYDSRFTVKRPEHPGHPQGHQLFLDDLLKKVRAGRIHGRSGKMQEGDPNQTVKPQPGKTTHHGPETPRNELPEQHYCTDGAELHNNEDQQYPLSEENKVPTAAKIGSDTTAYLGFVITKLASRQPHFRAVLAKVAGPIPSDETGAHIGATMKSVPGQKPVPEAMPKGGVQAPKA